MKEEFVSFEQAKLLKELGFLQGGDLFYGKFKDSSNIDDWKIEPVTDSYEYPIYETCSEYYNCPSLSLVQKWLREEKEIYLDIISEINSKWENGVFFEYTIMIESEESLLGDYVYYDTYEKALSAGIDKCIELLKEKI